MLRNITTKTVLNTEITFKFPKMPDPIMFGHSMLYNPKTYELPSGVSFPGYKEASNNAYLHSVIVQLGKISNVPYGNIVNVSVWWGWLSGCNVRSLRTKERVLLHNITENSHDWFGTVPIIVKPFLTSTKSHPIEDLETGMSVSIGPTTGLNGNPTWSMRLLPIHNDDELEELAIKKWLGRRR